jgi:hypothetical protein
MKRNRTVAAVAGVAVAGVAVISGCGIAHHDAVTPAHSANAVSSKVHQVSARPMATSASAIKTPKASGHASPHPSTTPTPTASADPSLVWLESAGGQAQVTVNDDLDTLASDLETENQSPTVANHLVFEADARVVRGEAQQILADPALLPTVNRAGYEQMLNDFIVVANLLQPGPDYGTTAQDDAAWATAMNASDINVS